jgi:lipoyl synthase
MADSPATKRPLKPGDVALKSAPKEALISGDGDSMFELPVVQAPQVANVRGQRPDWLRVKLPYGETFKNVSNIIDDHRLHTVCQSARCPNMGECWSAGTATFMILGNVCTRSCGFCAIKTGRPEAGLDWDEPKPRPRRCEADEPASRRDHVRQSRRTRRRWRADLSPSPSA